MSRRPRGAALGIAARSAAAVVAALFQDRVGWALPLVVVLLLVAGVLAVLAMVTGDYCIPEY